MNKVLIAFAGVAAILLSAIGISHADYCLVDQLNSSYVLVGRGFTPPLKGACKAFVGFLSGSANAPVGGSACTNSTGTTLNFSLTSSHPEIGNSVYYDTITLSLPSQSGGDEYTDIVGATVSTGFADFDGGTCSGKPVPAISTEDEGASPPRQ